MRARLEDAAIELARINKNHPDWRLDMVVDPVGIIIRASNEKNRWRFIVSWSDIEYSRACPLKRAMIEMAAQLWPEATDMVRPA